MKLSLLLGALLLCMSCANHRPLSSSSILGPHAPQGSWVDLLPQMELKIENAYFDPATPRQDPSGYLGTEIARYQVGPGRGLWPLGMQTPLAMRPKNQPSAQELISHSRRRHRKYRFFYAVVFTQQGTEGGSVLLGGSSLGELDRLSAELLVAPYSVCGERSRHCTVFPNTCTVSLEMQIVVNGQKRSVPWRSILASVVPGARHIELMRGSGANHVTSQSINPANPEEVRTALLPGDQVHWN
jgi:hypothetical protein